MQPLHQGQCLMIERPDMIEARLDFGGFDRFRNGFHV
jgi:hypothetical protein